MRFFLTVWIFVCILGVALVACGDSTPHVTNATLGTIVTASKIEDPKTTFAVTDHNLHLVVDVNNALTNTTVGAKWYELNSNRLLFEGDAALDPFNTTADFALTSAQDWTPGNYQVVVYLDGKKERTVDFVIK